MKCRLCEKQTEAFLRIPTTDLAEPFLDGSLRGQLPELKLRRCPECACLWADDARQDEAVLAEAYEQVSDRYFDAQEDDPRYVRFYARLERALQRHVSGRTLLDVGCGDGVFLAALSDQWTKRGVEPSVSGARLAQKKDLEVVCANLDTLNLDGRADLISALDVIEHVVDPHAFVDSFKRHLRPGGYAMLLTGDAASYPARTAGPHWSYLRWCGHVSVFSRAGLRRLLESHDFEILYWQRCEHPSSPGAVAWWRVHVLERLRRALGRNRSWYPFWRDHQVVIAQLK
jgi:SAM-dependent methyltransferase